MVFDHNLQLLLAKISVRVTRVSHLWKYLGKNTE